jgi:hypothetical protein
MIRRCSVVVVALLAACSEKPQPTAIQRGEALFRPVAEKLGATIAGDLKKTNPDGFDQYLKEIGGKDEADLVKKVSTETLVHYAEALSVSSSKEADLKAGRFDDEMNRRRLKPALETFAKPTVSPPHLCKVLLDKRSKGEWATGLELEFMARVLESEAIAIAATMKR